jgi:chemotaxis protein histidine kinase CheA
MDSSQALLNERRHKDDIDPVLPWPPAAKVRHDEPRAPSHSATLSPEHIDISAEETCPAPGPQSFAPDALRKEPVFESAQAPSATTFELMNQLDALAQDLAAKSHASVEPRIEPDQRSEVESVREADVEEEVKIPAAVPAPEPSIHVSPRPSGFEGDPLASNTRSTGRTVFKLAGIVTAALIGVGAAVAWQSYRVSTAKLPADAGVAAEQAGSNAQAAASPAVIPQSAPAAQTAQAPAAPEVTKQLEAMAQDLALVRRSLEQLTAKQEQLAAAQQQLEQLAAKQGQLAAKQEQMAQSIAKLQPREQTVRPRVSTPAPSRPAPVPPRVSAEPPPAPVSSAPPPRSQVSSAPPPRSAEPHPLPPLPVPP